MFVISNQKFWTYTTFINYMECVYEMYAPTFNRKILIYKPKKLNS
jgi:hypothetical protein